MHFGQPKKINLIAIGLFILLVQACKNNVPVNISFKSPDQGQNIKIGDEIKIQMDIPKEVSLKSIQYLIDGKPVAGNQNQKPFKLPTNNLKLGYRMITAIVAYDDQIDTSNINVVVKSDTKPKKVAYKVVKTFPHDTSAYTQGLSYVGGKLLESTGREGKSKLKWVDLNSGKTLQQTKLGDQYFGEGSLMLGDKIIMLTWRENTGFIFDARTFKQIGTFPYEASREGWGLTFDGQHILRTDGTNRIWMMNKETYKEEGFIEVYDDAGPVNSLNEMEYINGKIYANVYLTSKIVIIDPSSGKVEASIDLAKLVPQHFFKAEEEENNVLNGIAWDAAGKRLFVTGKKWPKLYQIELAQ
ncbi:glutaminyl-peptide cyclotransferase [Pedobacter insulae]|uniref:Glutamine cyclotransferase n=1 Tax=Pedobacter insulae TaxID=414048 RepID=A0A1I2YWN2_9SPHI|nr:glutaminyl-peptide cyclotransferase [Pedobacter insulae]SFH30024.1 Glutamine cyclotransferase [Pedobacter insulae]